MSRRAATVTQVEVERCLRAARSAGAGAVEVRPDGAIVIHMTAPASRAAGGFDVEKELADGEEAVL